MGAGPLPVRGASTRDENVRGGVDGGADQEAGGGRGEASRRIRLSIRSNATAEISTPAPAAMMAATTR
jgi:hypothetical protein